MKILVISDYLDELSSRPEAEIFMGLAREGLDVTIMTFPESPHIPAFERAGARVIPYHPKTKFDKDAPGIIRAELLRGGYDILQMYNSRAYFSGLKAAKGLPVKVIFYRGSIMNIHWYDPTVYVKYFHPRVDAIICNTKAVEDRFRQQAPPWIRKTFVTINKGHDPEWYAHVEPADLKKYGVNEVDFVFTCVANAQPVKGIAYLLRAMALLPRNLKLTLLLVGRNMDTEEFRTLAAQSGYEDRIHFVGYSKEVLSIDLASDVLVCPSTGAESLTKAVVEAMFLGIAPIITNIPGNKYLVEHSGTGLVVPPKNAKALADAMYAVYRKPEWAHAMGHKAKERVKITLNTRKTVAEMREFYTDLVSGKNEYRTKRSMF